MAFKFSFSQFKIILTTVFLIKCLQRFQTAALQQRVPLAKVSLIALDSDSLQTDLQFKFANTITIIIRKVDFSAFCCQTPDSSARPSQVIIKNLKEQLSCCQNSMGILVFLSI
jgi:hypothetical protein